MLSEHTFVREEVFPSWFANAAGEFLSTLAVNFNLSFAGTTVSVVAGTGDQASVVAVAGNWRWIETTITRAHPGGAAGLFDIFVTAAANDIVATPNPFTDTTNRAFALAIVAHGSTPTIVAGVVDQYRLVGSCSWDGTRITSLVQTVGDTPSPTNDLPFPGDFKFSAQTADHGTNPQGGGSAWLLLAGTAARAVSAATYPGLYVALGSPGLTAGNFTLPYPAGRAFGAAGTGSGLTARAAGAMVGEETHDLTHPEMGTGTPVNADNNGAGRTVSVWDFSNTPTPHNNMQPTYFANVFIKT